MIMIGVSVPFKGFFDEEAMNRLRPALVRARELGAESTEIRNVKPGYDSDEVAKMAKFLTGLGFSLSIHGGMDSPETAVDDVFGPLSKILPELNQINLNITVHPFDGNNASALRSLSDHIIEKGYPITIALENKRLMPDGSQGDCASYVLEAVKNADRPNVGLCFDFGHYLYYVLKNHPEEPAMLPPREFFERVFHTHIHALRGHKTHFPLTENYDMPLCDYIARVAPGYCGIYNLELSFHKFEDVISPTEALEKSIAALKKALPPCAFEFERIRREFDDTFRSALGVFGKEKGLWYSQVNPSFGLFSSNGYRWAVDPAFRSARKLVRTPGQADTLLRGADLFIVTHGHTDHFEESTVRLLSANPAKWIIPDFLVKKALKFGLPPEKMIVAEKGKPIVEGPLTILPFEGRHYRPDTGKGVPEYGYLVSSPDLPSVVLPGDTRDYSPRPGDPHGDVCFAHVWLGDGLEDEENHPLARDLARFALGFSDNTILLTHLYECGRKDGRMWTRRHAEEVANEISLLSPGTKVLIPCPGEIFNLG